eukprot:CAMPEP_0198111414 /NCGR_PEP_ID=MMETSP1442-20131203/3374_1 /TAXON_ID= /ORGANISM="Craspedostauros australis, Strain CCMP3328" /LENGTH=235 /DNA_ID=CAMNT_0043767829 /DNA_START=146 /DNA_END=850 /DNA_ORIENTATION=-
MAAVGGEAGDTGGNAQLAETICDPAFKEYLFWTLKDDDERIRKILKTLLEALRKTFPERDESATTQSMEMTNNENSPREVDWLKRIMTFRKLIIDEVKKKGKMEGDVRSFSQMALLYEQDNVLAQWLYNGGNINNAKCAWNSIKGLGGFDDPSKDLRESVRIGLMKLYDARRDPATTLFAQLSVTITEQHTTSANATSDTGAEKMESPQEFISPHLTKKNTPTSSVSSSPAAVQA